MRLKHAGRVWVASGDYKVEPDGTCAAFEPIRCHRFISECTFGLPIYRWRPQREVLEGIAAWWRANRDAGRASVLYAYSLGKAQRAIAGLAAVLGDELLGPIYTHGAVEAMNRAYRESGVALPPTTYAAEAGPRPDWSAALIVAPPSAHGTPWTRRFGPASTAFASGWMRIRGTRRRRSVDRGFVLSDHVDWPGLLAAIDATGAEGVWLTHGYTAVVARYLRERGRMRCQWRPDTRGNMRNPPGRKDPGSNRLHRMPTTGPTIEGRPMARAAGPQPRNSPLRTLLVPAPSVIVITISPLTAQSRYTLDWNGEIVYVFGTCPVLAVLVCTCSVRPCWSRSRKYNARSCTWPSVRSTSTEKLVVNQVAAIRLDPSAVCRARGSAADGARRNHRRPRASPWRSPAGRSTVDDVVAPAVVGLHPDPLRRRILPDVRGRRRRRRAAGR